jgi:DNA-binding transcriptional LysR family regulator
MINETKIECFLCVAELLSFTKASEKLFVSQQAVSKHIAALESDVGLELIHRTHHEVKLTPAGESLYLFFSDTTQAYQSLVEKLRTDSLPGEAHSIHIGYQNWMDFGPQPGSAMNILRKQYPNLHLIGERHSPAALLQRLAGEMLDIALVHKRFIPAKSDFIVSKLFDTPMMIAVSEDHSLNKPGTVYTDFKTEPLLMDALEGENKDATIRRTKEESKPYNFHPKEIIVLPNRDSVYTEAEQNRGIFFGSDRSQLPSSIRIIKYETDVADTVCCVKNKNKDVAFINDYATLLVAAYNPEVVTTFTI